MKLSKKFLNDYVDITDIEYSDVAEKMVSVGNEYDSIERISNSTGLVVGEVLECVDHPNSDHLHITKTNIGTDIVQIVCGAPNCKAGIKVIVATIGAKLPGGEIKACKLAGVESAGMLCSLDEIGLPEGMVSEEDKLGIHILPEDAVVGMNALEALGIDDEVIDFELTANRGDLLSILGMAYEVGAVYSKEVKLPEYELKENNDDVNKTHSVEVKTDKCSIYLGKLVKNVKITESPEFIKSRLMASGIRPINNVVDISNYVMLEYGQPLHFFDADRLGNKVIVRQAEEGEKITTLDSKERTLTSEDIVIANEKEPVALAGVMGGLTTEVELDTKNIFIESAIFDSISIRRTSKSILRSEASNRYEKGIDPNRTVEAIKRAAYLLSKYADGEVVGGTCTYDVADHNDKVITVTMEKVAQVLGMNLTIEEVGDTLTRLGFTYTVDGETLTVTVPTRRMDVNIKEDLIEEIGRIYGFTKIEGKLPTLTTKRGSRSPMGNLIKDIRNRLAGLGLTQVTTYSLLSEEKSNMFVNGEYEKIRVLDPMTEDRVYLRKQLFTSLLDVYEYNTARKIKGVNIFETGYNYYKVNGEYKEDSLVAGLISDDIITNTWNKNAIKADFYTVKGIVENILEYLGFTNRYSYDNRTLNDLHPYRSCAIYIDRDLVGYMGQVHPKLAKKPIYMFELNLSKIITKRVRAIKCKEISKYPEVNKDLAFVVKKDVNAIDVELAIKKAGGRLLTNLVVFDVYTGENVGEDEKSIAYSLTFSDPTKTLNDEEVTNIVNKIISEVEKKAKGKLRDK